MITLNQAPVAREDVPTIVSYLAKHFGSNNPIKQLPMNINKSSVKMLATLPGISVETAQAVVEYRQTSGPFTSVDALLKVKGMNAAKQKRIKPYITTTD